MLKLVYCNRSQLNGITSSTYILIVFFIFLLTVEFSTGFYVNSGAQFIEISNSNIPNNKSDSDAMSYYLDPDDLTGDYPAIFPADKENINCCGTNSTICRDTFNDECVCDTSALNYCKCSCPATIKAIDYTVRLAAGVAIVILVGVSITLAISLYRRAISGYDNTGESGRRPSSSVNSTVTTTTVNGRPSIRDTPPCYDDIFVVSNESLQSDGVYNKLPSYEEALRSSTSAELSSLSIGIGKEESAQTKIETSDSAVVSSEDSTHCHITTSNNDEEEPVCDSIATPPISHVMKPSTNSESSSNMNHSDC